VYVINMMAAPVLPQYIMQHYGLSVATAGLAVSCLSLAPVLLDVPGNLIADRVGPHCLGLFAVVCCIACGLMGLVADVTNLFWVLLVARILNGVGQSTFQMSRILLVSRAPAELRASAMATMGLMQRLGSLIGPLIGSYLVRTFGIYGVFVAQALCGLLVFPLPLLPVMMPSTRLIPDFVRGSGVGGKESQSSIRGMMRCLVRNWRDYATAGFTLCLLNVLRQAKDFMIVIKVFTLGGGPTETGLAVTLAYVFDVGCSPVSGILMGKFGRKYSMAPALLLLGSACGLLGTPMTRSIPGVMLAACLGGAGNGLSSGLGMCVGSDFAVKREEQGSAVSKAEFLGPWRTMMDLGQLIGPCLAGAVVTSFSLPAAAATCAAVGVLGVLSTVMCVTESSRL